TLCRDLSKQQAGELLEMLQRIATRITPRQLRAMGRQAWKDADLVDGYACLEGSFDSGLHAPHAHVPYLVEAWAGTFKPKDLDSDDVYNVGVAGFTINRTPALLKVSAYREGRSRKVNLALGDLFSELSLPQGCYHLAINITSPYIPII